MRDFCGGGKNNGDGNGNGNGDGKCRAPLSRNLVVTALVWSSRLRLRPRSLRMTPMVATAVLPLSAGRLSRQEAG
jgi:hypothetical protein